MQTKLDLILLIEQKKEISEICKGQCSIFLMADGKNYCTLAKGHLNLKCYNLYDFPKFHHACLYEKQKNS